MRQKAILFLILHSTFFIFHSFGQRPKGYFLTDSIEIGRPFRFALSYRHKPETEVFFPDTSFRFTPFKALSYEYFDTITDANESVDSAVYTLVSFDLSEVQKLSIPIWILTPKDCTAIYSVSREIPLHRLTKLNKSVPLKIDTQLIPLEQKINYPLILIILILTSLVSLGVYLIFNQQIQRQWRLYQLYSRNKDFKKALNRIIKKNEEKIDIQEIERGVILWKKYMQRLERKPFITYTTKEIIDNLPDERLEEALREIDRVIYGEANSSKILASLKTLNLISEESYFKRREALR